MAHESPVQNLCEEATCPICLEYFKDPVIIDCGHNFCQVCITQCWGESDTDVSCPQCREPCQPKNFRPNRPLASMVEIAKKFCLQMAKGAEALGRVCERHQESLKLFCKDDQVPICVVCDRSKEHRAHRVVPVEEADQEYKEQIQSHLEFLKKKREAILSSKLQGETERKTLLKTTDAERQNIVADFKQLHQFLEEKEHLLLADLKSLDDEIEAYGNKHIAKLSEEISSVDDLIKDIEEKLKQTANDFLQDIGCTLQRCKRDKFVNPTVFPIGLNQSIGIFSRMHPFLNNAMKEFKDTLLNGPQEMKETLTNDEDMKIPTLGLSIASPLLQNYNFNDYQFNDFNQIAANELKYSCYVLGTESIATGSHSWVVDVGNERFWAVGVAKENLDHNLERWPRAAVKGNSSQKPRVWAVGKKTNGAYNGFTSSEISLGRQPWSFRSVTWCGSQHHSHLRMQRIRVTLNYDKGHVAFIDDINEIDIFSFNGISFSGEKICSWLSKGE